MNIRIGLSVFGYHLGAVDIDLDLCSAIPANPTPQHEVTIATQAMRRGVKRISRLWVRGMVS